MTAPPPLTLARLLGHAGAALDARTPPEVARAELRAYHLAALPVTRGGQVLGVVTPEGADGGADLEGAVQAAPLLDPQDDVAAARAALDGFPAVLVRAHPPGALSPADLQPSVRPDLARTVWAALRPDDADLLRTLARLAGPAARVALVGGAVRDALLGAQPIDLDVVVTGADVVALARASGLPHVWHARYMNATLKRPDGRGVDLVSARAEAYPQPGGPPEPRRGTLAQDLLRRDFAVNALALVVGEVGLHDPAGGLEEVFARTLRPLHAGSFHDDASRLVRAARLAARLNFTAHPDLLAQVPQALAVADVTPRLWAELRLALDEPRPGRVLALLEAWGAGALLPGGAARLLPLDAQRDAGAPVPEGVYAALLVDGAPDPAARLGLGEAPAGLLQRARSARPYPPASLEGQVRAALGLPPGPLLRGEDLLALGVPRGPQVGRLLARLDALRPSSREAAVRAVLSWLADAQGDTGPGGPGTPDT